MLFSGAIPEESSPIPAFPRKREKEHRDDSDQILYTTFSGIKQDGPPEGSPCIRHAKEAQDAAFG